MRTKSCQPPQAVIYYPPSWVTEQQRLSRLVPSWVAEQQKRVGLVRQDTSRSRAVALTIGAVRGELSQ